MSDVGEIRLYHNTVDSVPAGYTDITNDVITSSTKTNEECGIKRYLNGVAALNGLRGATIYYLWVELIDSRGNSSGPLSIGVCTTTARLITDANMVQYGNNIVQEGDFMRFNGNNSYVRFADMTPSWVDYGNYVRSGSWCMTFWIKSITGANDRKLLSLRQENIGFFSFKRSNIFQR
jgi:hypothetical protein